MDYKQNDGIALVRTISTSPEAKAAMQITDNNLLSIIKRKFFMPDNPLPAYSAPYVNTETGELIEDFDTLGVLTDDLPKVGQSIAYLERQMAMIDKFVDEQVERLEAAAAAKKKPMLQSAAFLRGKAEQMATIIGVAPKKPLNYPGLGTFRFRTMPDKVDCTGFEERDVMKQLDAIEAHSHLFRTKTEPDKSVIRAELTGESVGDREMAARAGFSLMSQPPKFEFKKED